MKHFCLPLLRDVIKRIDQSEFEGFEYINPLLLSTEESVWRGDQLPHSPTYCLSKLPSQPKKKSQANIERRGGGRAKDRNSGSGLVNKAKQTGGWESFPSCVMLIVLLGYQNLLSWYLWGEMKKLNYEKVFFLFPPSVWFLPSECPISCSSTAGFVIWTENCFFLCLPSWTHFNPSHVPGWIWQFRNFRCTFVLFFVLFLFL